MADKYFSWLVNKVCRNTLSESFERNDIVLNVLYSRIFTFSIPMDRNRVSDAIELRDRFKVEEGLYNYKFESSDISVLEVLIALSLRCEESIMGDCKKDRTYKWFWLMIGNLDIKGCKDESYIHHAIDVFLDRTYNSDGTDGGLFHVENPRSDLRKTEIWYQMCWYLSETLID